MSFGFRHGKVYNKGMTVEEAMNAAADAVCWMMDTVCALELLDDDGLQFLLDAAREEAERRGLDG